ncbi:MAG: hypothetical protein M5U26_24510 [Planctomycetota bacterium]|nr:hypothetical protein [Planctomycetota bacterium]
MGHRVEDGIRVAQIETQVTMTHGDSSLKWGLDFQWRSVSAAEPPFHGIPALCWFLACFAVEVLSMENQEETRVRVEQIKIMETFELPYDVGALRHVEKDVIYFEYARFCLGESEFFPSERTVCVIKGELTREAVGDIEVFQKGVACGSAYNELYLGEHGTKNFTVIEWGNFNRQLRGTIHRQSMGFQTSEIVICKEDIPGSYALRKINLIRKTDDVIFNSIRMQNGTIVGMNYCDSSGVLVVAECKSSGAEANRYNYTMRGEKVGEKSDEVLQFTSSDYRKVFMIPLGSRCLFADPGSGYVGLVNQEGWPVRIIYNVRSEDSQRCMEKFHVAHGCIDRLNRIWLLGDCGDLIRIEADGRILMIARCSLITKDNEILSQKRLESRLTTLKAGQIAYDFSGDILIVKLDKVYVVKAP